MLYRCLLDADRWLLESLLEASSLFLEQGQVCCLIVCTPAAKACCSSQTSPAIETKS